MGKRRGRGRTSHDNWWKQSTGGVAHWVLVSLVGALIVGGGLVAINLPERTTVAAPGATPQTDFTFGADKPPKTRIAYLGDSWTSGTGAADSSTAYTYVANADLGAVYETFSGGGTGYTTGNPASGDGPFVDRVDEVIAWAPDVVVVQGSSNDYAANQQTIYEDALEVFTMLRQGLPEAKIVALGMIHSPDSPVRTDDISLTAVSEAAAASGVQFVNGNEPTPWLDIDTDFADGYHPNPVGHEKVGRNLAEALRPLIEG